MTGADVEQAADVSLIGLDGFLNGRSFQFLLDSGASCNFISKQFLEAQKIEWDLVVSRKVRLADGTLLSTCGCVQLEVSFGNYVYKGAFQVL